MLQIAPHRYQSARGALQQIGENLEPLGERALVVASKTALERFEDVVRASLKDSMIGVSLDVNLGPCCLPEVERLNEVVEKENADIVVGLGGGQTLDVAKYVAHKTSRASVSVPTVASTCAGFTNLIYLYNDDGEFVESQQLPVCPDLTVLDYKVSGLAPSRFLAAGMGLAWASSTEFSLSRDDLELNQPRQIAYRLANHIQDSLNDKGEKAMADVKRGEVTSTVESVLEVNVLETGLLHCIGGRSFRSTVSHQLAHHLRPYTGEEILFGEIVAFGVIVQEQLRETPSSDLAGVFEFYRDIDLPLTLDDLGLPENQRETILADAGEEIIDQLSDMKLPFELEEELFLEAVNSANELGKAVTQSGPEAIE